MCKAPPWRWCVSAGWSRPRVRYDGSDVYNRREPPLALTEKQQKDNRCITHMLCFKPPSPQPTRTLFVKPPWLQCGRTQRRAQTAKGSGGGGKHRRYLCRRHGRHAGSHLFPFLDLSHKTLRAMPPWHGAKKGVPTSVHMRGQRRCCAPTQRHTKICLLRLSPSCPLFPFLPPTESAQHMRARPRRAILTLHSDTHTHRHTRTHIKSVPAPERALARTHWFTSTRSESNDEWCEKRALALSSCRHGRYSLPSTTS